MLRICALQHKTLNQLKNSSTLLQTILYECHVLLAVRLRFNLQTICFSHDYMKKFKNLIFLVYVKTQDVTISHLPHLFHRHFLPFPRSIFCVGFPSSLAHLERSTNFVFCVGNGGPNPPGVVWDSPFNPVIFLSLSSCVFAFFSFMGSISISRSLEASQAMFFGE